MIERLRELEAAATKGPWHADEGFGGVWVVTGARADFAVHPHAKEQEHAVLNAGDYANAYRDADLVVAARNALPALLAAAEALPADPYVGADSAGTYCYSCGWRPTWDPTHAPDCAWSKAMALRGEG